MRLSDELATDTVDALREVMMALGGHIGGMGGLNISHAHALIGIIDKHLRHDADPVYRRDCLYCVRDILIHLTDDVRKALEQLGE